MTTFTTDQQLYCGSTNIGGAILLGVNDSFLRLTSPPFTIGMWLQLRSYPPRLDPWSDHHSVLLHMANDLIMGVNQDGGIGFWIPWNDSGGAHWRNPKTAYGILDLMRWVYLEFTVTSDHVELHIDGKNIPLDGAAGPADDCFLPICLGGLYKPGMSWSLERATIDVDDVRIWSGYHSAERSWQDQYFLPVDPSQQLDLLVYHDFSVNPPALRKAVNPSIQPVSFLDAGSMNQLGVPCDVNILPYIFYGDYMCWRKAADGTWTPEGTMLTIGRDGSVSYGQRTIQNVVFDCDGIHFTAETNPFAASVWLATYSDDVDIWGQPLMRACFEGVVSADGISNVQLFRGARMPRLTDPCIMMSGQGMFVQVASPTSVALVSTLSPRSQQQAWSLTDEGFIFNKAADKVLGLNTDPVSGAVVALVDWSTDDPRQVWTNGDDGAIVLESVPTLALTASPDNRQLVLSALQTPPLPSQVWMSLMHPFHIIDYQNRLLSNVGGGSLRTVTEGGDTAAADWYLQDNFIISAQDGSLVTLSGGAVSPGTPAVLAYWQTPGVQRPDQEWNSDSTMILSLKQAGTALQAGDDGAITLQTENDSLESQQWAMILHSGSSLQKVPALRPAPGPDRKPLAGPQDQVTYIITVQTSNDWWAATGARAQVGFGTNVNHYKLFRAPFDGFECGSQKTWSVQTDVFSGSITELVLKEGEGFASAWKVDWVEIYDSHLGQTSRFSVGQWIESRYWHFRNPTITLGTCPLELNFYPARFELLGMTCDAPPGIRVLSHTYLVLRDTPGTQVYFDCAGGHDPCPGDVTRINVQSTLCKVTDAVRMAMGLDISPSNPLKRIYGHDDVDAVETAGVRASGFRRRDGLCHQIANRMLYTGTPRSSIAQLAQDRRPGGYGLGCMLFGEYGSGFADRCASLNFPPPPEEYSQRLNCIRMIIGDVRQNILDHLTYLFNDFRLHYMDLNEYLPHGQGIQSWYTRVQQDNQTLMHLTDDQVRLLFKDEL